jgi:hypothetical protein
MRMGRGVGLGILLAWSLTALWSCGDEFQAESSTEEETCPTDTSVPCEADPWNCGDGQTCWFNATADAMQCLNSFPEGTAGAACDPIAGAPTCGDRMLCTSDRSGGPTLCRPYCDPTVPCKGCPSGLVCSGVNLVDPDDVTIATVSLCMPPP